METRSVGDSGREKSSTLCGESGALCYQHALAWQTVLLISIQYFISRACDRACIVHHCARTVHVIREVFVTWIIPIRPPPIPPAFDDIIRSPPYNLGHHQHLSS